MSNITLTDRDDRVIEIRQDGDKIGYVDEDGDLWGIDNAGFAQRIDQVNNRTEIVGKLREWQKKQSQGQLI